MRRAQVAGSIKWDPNNLQKHYDRHPGSAKEERCWMDLFGVSVRITKDEYEMRSIRVITARWLEYECEEWSPSEQRYYPRRTHYVDAQEVKVIADWSEGTIKTCYHEHYDLGHVTGRHNSVPLGELQGDYKRHLQYGVDARSVRNLNITVDTSE